MGDTTDMLDDEMIDPVTGETIDPKDLAERLLAQAKEQGWDHFRGARAYAPVTAVIDRKRLLAMWANCHRRCGRTRQRSS